MEDSVLSLRPAVMEDVPELLKIERQVYVAPWTAEHFYAELSKPYSQTYVLTDDETDTRVAGYVVCWMMLEGCQILNLAVDLPFRGLGLAKLMVRKVIAMAVKQGIEKVTLEVRKSNMPAIQFYQGLGFTITHRFKGFYSNGEDAYQMSLSIQHDPIVF